jgi:hypothetical protein
MSEKWAPKLPDRCRCVICSKEIGAEPFLASKPKRGKLAAVHTRCWEAEQKDLKGEVEA